MNKYEIVYWRDAIFLERHRFENIVDKQLPLVKTIGEVVHEDRKKVIVRTHGDVHEESALGSDDGEDFMVIPKGWIEQRIGLKEELDDSEEG